MSRARMQIDQNVQANVADDFRQSMRRLAASVTVISLSDGESRYGMTATAVASLSVLPPSLVACVNNMGAFYKYVKSCARFCVNILHCDQREISEAFSSRLSHDERFWHGEWDYDAQVVPYLKSAQANIFCNKVKLIPFGSHDIVIGEVYSAQFRNDVAPLIYCGGSYMSPL